MDVARLRVTGDVGDVSGMAAQNKLAEMHGMHVYIHTRTHTHTYTHTYTYIHTYIQTYTHTHTHAHKVDYTLVSLSLVCVSVF